MVGPYSRLMCASVLDQLEQAIFLNMFMNPNLDEWRAVTALTIVDLGSPFWITTFIYYSSIKA